MSKKSKRAAKTRGESEEALLEKIPPLNQPFSALKDMRAKMEADAKRSVAGGSAKVIAPAPPPIKSKPLGPETRLVTRVDENEDDALSFHRLMSGVVPLSGANTRVPRTETNRGTDAGEKAKARRAEGDAVVAREADEVREHLRTLVDDARFEVNDDGTRVEGKRVDLAPDLLRKLRRGMFPIDARLDLHGLDARAASERIEAFLREKRSDGERCVLIVHGRGAHSAGGVGVLRGEIAAWLSQGRTAHHVAAFATAARDDGGEGAVYVLLRR